VERLVLLLPCLLRLCLDGRPGGDQDEESDTHMGDIVPALNGSTYASLRGQGKGRRA